MPSFSVSQGTSVVEVRSDAAGFSQNSPYRYYLNNGSSSARSDSFFVTFADGASIRLTDFSEIPGSWGGSDPKESVIGIPGASEGGFSNSFNIIGGYGASARFDIYDNTSGLLLLDNYLPQDPFQGYFQPYAQVGYSGGSLTVQAPRTTFGFSGQAEINSTGTGQFSRPVGPYVGGRSGTAVNQHTSGGAGNPWVFALTIPGPPAPVCFAKGTLIMMAEGNELPIHTLSIGDLVTTSKGALPIKWIGRRTVKRSLSTEQFYKGALPVKIEANAFDKGIPSQDLYVSDRHGILADGNIVNASYLENGCNIYRVAEAEFPDQIDYFHLEFEDEVLVYANGLQACSYVNVGTRRSFDNYAEFISLYVNVDSTVKSHVTAFKRTRPSLQGHKQRTKRSWQTA